VDICSALLECSMLLARGSEKLLKQLSASEDYPPKSMNFHIRNMTGLIRGLSGMPLNKQAR